MKPIFLIIPVLQTGCATSAELSDTYTPPSWNRSYCAGIDWARQGAEDALRYKNGEKRLAALDRVCGIHFLTPRDEYLTAFKAAQT